MAPASTSLASACVGMPKPGTSMPMMRTPLISLGSSCSGTPEAVGIPVLAAIPANEDIRRKSANYQIIGTPDGEWGPLFAGLAQAVADSLPQHPRPLTQDGLLGLFDPDSTGAGVTLIPATQADVRGVSFVAKKTLEVVYDEAV